MNHTKHLGRLLALWLLPACLSLPGVDSSPNLEVQLTLPGDPTYTNGTVAIHVGMNELKPDKVELFLGDTSLATLSAPYDWTWDTRGVAEGTYSLTARVTQGSRSAVSPARRVIVDRTPPKVISQAPAPNARNIPNRQLIRVEFSEPIKSDTVTNSSVALTANGTDASKTLELSANGQSLTITPETSFNPPTTVAATLAESITDLAGNSLEAGAVTWSWQVPAWLPVGPEAGVSEDVSVAAYPRLRLHPTYGAVLAWTNHTETTVKRWTGTAWESVGRTLRYSPIEPGSRLSAPDILFDRTGGILSAWSEDWAGTPPRYADESYVSRWSGSDWKAFPLTPFGHSVPGNSDPSIEFDPGGFLWLATPVDDYRNLNIQRWTGQSWEALTAPFRSDPSKNSRIYTPTLRFDLEGHLVIAWNEFDIDEWNHEVNGRIHVWRWRSAGWEKLGGPIKADARLGEAMRPRMEFDKNGNPILVWGEYSDNCRCQDIHVWQWSNNQWKAVGSPLSAWGDFSTGDNYFETPASDPCIALDGQDNPIVAWIEIAEYDPNPPTRINIRRWTGSEWQAFGGSGYIPGTENAVTCSIQVDASGASWVAWDAYLSNGRRVYVYRFNQ